MKDQYVGDRNDYPKYALLRRLASHGKFRVGVCWMLTPPDATSHGNHIGYLKQPTLWRLYDPEVFDLLAQIRLGDGTRGERKGRGVWMIEDSGIIPDALYVNLFIPDDATSRKAYFEIAQEQLRKCDLVFYDPDNGIEIATKQRGQKESSKYVYLDEISATYAGGQSVLIYQHFKMFEKHEVTIPRAVKMIAGVCPGAALWVFRTPHTFFLLAAQPSHARRIERLKSKVAPTQWDPKFMTCERWDE